MKISDLMLTDEQRRKALTCTIGAGNTCGYVRDTCRLCLDAERAAIAHAVMVLADKCLFAPWKWINAPLDDKSEGKQLMEAFALLAECRKVVGK